MTASMLSAPADTGAPSRVEFLDENIKWLHRYANRNRAEMLDAVGQFDEEGYSELYGEPSTAVWLRRELNLPGSTAFEYVRVARGLRAFPLLFDTFQSGIMPYSTVRFLLKYMTPENEEELIDLAVAVSFSELNLCLAGAEPAEKVEPQDPFVRASERDDGSLAIDALLPPVTGQEFLAALKIAQLANFGLDGAEDLDLSDPEIVDALLENQEEESCPGEQVRGARATPRLSAAKIAGAPSRYGPPTKGDMYAAFLAMVDMVRSNPISPLRSPGAQVNIMVTEDGRCWMPENPSARSEVVKHYVANACHRVHTLDREGLTINVGRAQRFATDGQVQALLAAWGYQCAMPGCSHRRFLQIHHIHEWEHGGPTDLWNLIPLCSSCHSKVSNGTTTIRLVGSDIRFTFFDGSMYVSRNRGVPRKVRDGQGPAADRDFPRFDD